MCTRNKRYVIGTRSVAVCIKIVSRQPPSIQPRQKSAESHLNALRETEEQLENELHAKSELEAENQAQCGKIAELEGRMGSEIEAKRQAVRSAEVETEKLAISSKQAGAKISLSKFLHIDAQAICIFKR